ncbi:cytochrome b [Beijerinckia sp. L45]|uniref:cytochrome b n=1 Tax=Beijerinckia sp. L45 TaxID=1641855 RepID=UPI00131A6D14|nr:cytochrome b [Beijerinckia sp. L45]
MSSATSRLRYTIVAIAFHWLIALGVLLLICIGLAMTNLGLAPMRQFQLYQLHKSIGITVLILSLLRLIWRFGHRPPPLPAAMPRLEQRAASATHGVLYGLIIGMPLTGWAMVSASKYNIPTVLYGLVPWPHLPVFATLPNKAAVEAVLKQVHEYGAWVLIALLVLHVGAALRHHFALRDDTLWQMLPVVSRPTVHQSESIR